METILNIYLVIENERVTSLKAKGYEVSGSDEEKIAFLKSRAEEDYNSSVIFDAPANKDGKNMSYSAFAKLEKQGMHIRLFEEIFSSFNVPELPLICVTPVLDGEILAEK